MPWMTATVAPPSVRPDHDLHARHRSDQRLLEEAELPVPEQADAGEDRVNRTVMPMTPGATNCR